MLICRLDLQVVLAGLELANALVAGDASVMETMCLVGIVPTIARFAAASWARGIRLQAALFVQQLCRTSLATAQMFVACQVLTFVSLASCQHCCQVPVRCMLSVGWQCQNGNPPLLHHSKSRVNSCTMCTEAMMKPMHAFTGIEVSVLSTKCICTCHEVSRAFCHQTCRVCLSWSG